MYDKNHYSKVSSLHLIKINGKKNWKDVPRPLKEIYNDLHIIQNKTWGNVTNRLFIETVLKFKVYNFSNNQ